MIRSGANLPHKSPGILRMMYRALLASFSILVFTTCDLPPTFGPEYDVTTTNFISGLPLANPSVAADANGAPEENLPAVWDWAWRGNTGNSFEYMTLTDAGTTVVSDAFTLAETETAWRLELANLAADPYFEDSIPDGWTATAPATVSLPTSITSHGQYIELRSNSNNWAGFYPGTPGFILDDPLNQTEAIYKVAAYSQTSSVKYTIDDITPGSFDDPRTSNLDGTQIILDTFNIDSADTRVMFAFANVSQTIDLDDLRISRLDTANDYCLRLRLRPTDTSLVLAPGQYEFSIWVKAPEDALPRGSPSRVDQPEAPFASATIRLELRQVGFSETGTTIKQFTGVFPVSSDWTRVALRMGDGNLDRFEDNSTEAVIELAIYPFGELQDLEPGAVLIAAPSLRFFRNGYTD
jgi:hypothetical protein